ncbi:MAG: methenyltetrahydromethanopterin cyclohydrolase [Planctomycetales bacterium]|nr:methenyltetrahydromethanopterin cyclohydrolase [Planctomycetales bacterium]
MNRTAHVCFLDAAHRKHELQLVSSQLECRAQVLDFGVQARGGLAAGLQLATICMAGRASIVLSNGDRSVWPGAWVQVTTDQALDACMLSQYAGWPVKHEKFFAMGSGAMRLRRGREQLLQDLQASDADDLAVGTLECDELPSNALAEAMADECQIDPSQLYLAVAPTRSTAGCVQVVARCVETCMHKLHELGFELERVLSAHGLAPVPPATPDFAAGIGRTNDAILYGGQVVLWIDADDEQLADIGARLPSSASPDFGRPFAEIFKQCNYDFYKIDPGLFSPAEVTLMNVRTGNSWRFGALRGDLVSQSFGTRIPKG